MSNGFETVIYQREGPIAQVSLNRPQVINAYNVQMRDELYQVLQAVRDDPGVGVVILRGEGERGFCAGADLTEFGTAPSQAVARQVRWERDVWGLFLELPQPLICAMHGYVIGSGVEMAMLCDLRIAAEDVVFAMPEVSLGMIPAAGGTQTVARGIGVSPTLEMLLLNRRIGPPEALRMGLAHRVVQRNALEQETNHLAEELLHRDPALVRAIKEALRRGADLPLDQGLDLEERLTLQVWMSGRSRTARAS